MFCDLDKNKRNQMFTLNVKWSYNVKGDIIGCVEISGSVMLAFKGINVLGNKVILINLILLIKCALYCFFHVLKTIISHFSVSNCKHFCPVKYHSWPIHGISKLLCLLIVFSPLYSVKAPLSK